MGSKRIQRGQGDDLAGLNVAHRSMIRDQSQAAAPKTKTAREFDSPQPDARVRGEQANVGYAGSAGFKVYREKEGGRAGGKGKRVTS